MILYQKVEILPFGGRIPTLGIDLREILLAQADPRAPQSCEISRELVQRVTPVGRKCQFLARE